jgi:hypothetical protein
LGSEDFHHPKIGLIFYLNSTFIACGTSEITNFTAYTMSKLECGLVNEEFETFVIISFPEPTRTCLEILRMNFLRS